MSSPAAPDSSPPSSSGAPDCPGATKPSLFCRYHATSLPGSSSTSPTKKHMLDFRAHVLPVYFINMHLLNSLKNKNNCLFYKKKL